MFDVLYNNPLVNNFYFSSISGAFLALLGIFVYVKKGKSNASLPFILMYVFLSVWLIGNAFGMRYYDDFKASVLMFRIAYSGVPFCAILAYHFYLNLAGKRRIKLLIFLYVIAFLELIFLWMTDAIKEGMYSLPYVGAVWGGMPFFSYFLNFGMIKYAILMLLTSFLFFKAYKKEANLLKKQQYKIFSIIFLFFSLATTEWLVDFNIPLHIAWVFMPPVFVAAAYNIINNKALDIETAIHKTLMWLAASMILIYLPIFMLSAILREPMINLNIFAYSAVLSFIVYFFIRIYNGYQPKIDHVFRKKAYRIDEKINKLALDLSTIINTKDLGKVLDEAFKNIFYIEKSWLYLEDNGRYICREDNSERQIIGKKIVDRLKLKETTITEDELAAIYKKEKIKFPGEEFKNIRGAVPIIHSDALMGFILFGRKENLARYAISEYQAIERIAKNCAAPLYNAKKHEELLKIEIETKERIQKFNIELENQVKARTKELEAANKIIEKSFANLQKKDILLKEKIDKLEVMENTESLVKSLTDGLILYNKKQEVLLINPIAEELIQEDQGQTKLEKLDMLLGEVDLFSKIKKSIENSKIIHISDVVINHKYYEIFITQVKDYKDNIVGGLIIIHDINDLKLVDQMKTDFVSVASHQLRTPLTAIKLFANMLHDGDVGKLTKVQSEYMQNMIESIERMVNLVNDLLNVTRIEAAGIKIEPVPVDIVYFIESVIEEIKPLNKNQAGFQFTHPKNKLPLISLDKTLLRQIIYNLLTNSIKYSGKGKIVINLTDYDKKNYQISVADEGMGIPEKVKDRIFTKFFRADNAVKSETEGSGLGLYVAKMIANYYGGKIWLETEENKGTTFYFTLPKKGMEKRDLTKKTVMIS